MGQVEGTFLVIKHSSTAVTVSLLLLTVAYSSSLHTPVVCFERGPRGDSSSNEKDAHGFSFVIGDEIPLQPLYAREERRLQTCQELEWPSRVTACQPSSSDRSAHFQDDSVGLTQHPKDRGTGGEEEDTTTTLESNYVQTAVSNDEGDMTYSLSHAVVHTYSHAQLPHTSLNVYHEPSGIEQNTLFHTSFTLLTPDHENHEDERRLPHFSQLPERKSRESTRHDEGDSDVDGIRLERRRIISRRLLHETTDSSLTRSAFSPVFPLVSTPVRRLGAAPSSSMTPSDESDLSSEETKSSEAPKEVMGLFGGGGGLRQQRQQMAQAMSMMGMRMPPPGSMTPQQQQQMMMMMYRMQEQQRLMGQQAAQPTANMMNMMMMMMQQPYQQQQPSPQMMQQMLALQQQQQLAMNYGGRGGGSSGRGGRRQNQNSPHHNYNQGGMYGFNSNMGNPYSYYPNNSFPMMNGISNNPMYSYYPNMNTMPSASMPPGAGGMPSPMQPQQALPSPGTMAGMYYNSNNTPSQPYSMATANQSNTPGMPPGGVPQTMSSGSGTGGGMMRGFSSNQQETGDRGSGGGGGGQYNTTPYDPNLAQEQRRIDEGARWAEQLRRQQENWARNNT